MKRRGFFGALLGLPAAAKAMAEIKPVPIEVNEVVDYKPSDFGKGWHERVKKALYGKEYEVYASAWAPDDK